MNEFDGKFFSKRKHIAWRAKPVCDALDLIFKPKTVIDVGCGIGEFLLEFQNRGIIAHGTENTEDVYPYLMIPKTDILINDITTDLLTPDKKYDLALCFMVVGRLPEKTWNRCAEYLTRLSDTIVTVVEKEWYWTQCMRKQGFGIDAMATVQLRNLLNPLFNKTAVKSFQYSQVFRRINE